jgi:death-on-curing family protein
LPRNKSRIYKLEVGFALTIHDELVSRIYPGADPVEKGALRDRGLLESALSRPFQSAFGEDAYSGIIEKAAALFHSLVANHCFVDGNKRTASIALQMFLVANSIAPLLSDEQIYNIARETAAHTDRGVSPAGAYDEILATLRAKTVSFDEVRSRKGSDAEFRSIYADLLEARREYRKEMTAIEG